MSRLDHIFNLRQDGMIVASVSGPDREQALREIMHYALVYSEDGPCTVEGITDEDWKAILGEFKDDRQ